MAKTSQRKQEKEALSRIRKLQKCFPKTEKKWMGILDKSINTQSAKIHSRIKEIEGQIKFLNGEIKTFQVAIAKEKSNLTMLEKSLVKGKEREEFAEKIKQILRIKHVEAVDCTDNLIRVYTDMIYIRYGKARYKIGILEIIISLEEHCVRVHNLCSTHPQRRSHPYGSYGDICFGATSGPMVQALHDKEYAIAVTYILQSLQSASGDAPHRVTEWKKVS